MPKIPTLYEHSDKLTQPIRPGDYVAFSHSYTPGVLYGRVIKLTRLRVRIEYNYSNYWNGTLYSGVGKHLARPEQVIVLGDTLQQHLMLDALKQQK